MSLIDLYPTLCEAAGVPVPAGVEGSSLWPLYRGDGQPIRAGLFAMYDDLHRAVRTERFKLIEHLRSGHAELFDLELDPFDSQEPRRPPVARAGRGLAPGPDRGGALDDPPLGVPARRASLSEPNRTLRSYPAREARLPPVIGPVLTPTATFVLPYAARPAGCAAAARELTRSCGCFPKRASWESANCQIVLKRTCKQA